MTQENMDLLTDAFAAGAIIVVVGITAAAIVASGPRIASWGYRSVMRWFK